MSTKDAAVRERIPVTKAMNPQNHEPRILKFPDAGEVKQLVETIIVPGMADDQAKALTKLLMTVADEECNEKSEVAELAARHAFSQTDAFETAFRQFAGSTFEPIPTKQGTIEHTHLAG